MNPPSLDAQDVVEFNTRGEPFKTWAGPVTDDTLPPRTPAPPAP